jgi:aconitate hydratase
MSPSLTDQVVDAHRSSNSEHASESERALAVDHLVLGAESAARIASLLGGRPIERGEGVLVCEDARSTSEAGSGAHRSLARFRASGAAIARPGSGVASRLYGERFASPGKIVGSTEPALGCWGACGALVLDCDEIEAAGLLAGGPLVIPRPAITHVRLEGGLAPWTSGEDVALELARRLPPPRRGAVVEFGGDGLLDLTPSDRLALAAECVGNRERSALLPSDEIMRRHLKALGREADWKPLASTGARFDLELELDLDAIEPRIAPLGEPDRSRPVRHAMGHSVRRVVIGSNATVAQLVRIARALEGRSVHAETRLLIATGSRQIADTAAAMGVLDSLIRAGARIVDTTPRLTPERGDQTQGVCLCFGADPTLDREPDRVFVASPESCAAAAISGRITDPRELESEFVRDLEPEFYVRGAKVVLDPLGTREASSDGLPIVPASGSFVGPLVGPLRGTVLIRLGDHVPASEVLPRGARLAPLAGDYRGLSDHAFESVDPDFTRRARAQGVGFVLAGDAFGAGDPREEAAVILALLGVRVVIARSFDPTFLRRLVYAGVLPLRFRVEADLRSLDRGDELEIPGLPESLETGKPLALRDLTRGTQHALPHDLSSREVAIIRAGGLLPFVDSVRAF